MEMCKQKRKQRPTSVPPDQVKVSKVKSTRRNSTRCSKTRQVARQTANATKEVPKIKLPLSSRAFETENIMPDSTRLATGIGSIWQSPATDRSHLFNKFRELHEVNI